MLCVYKPLIARCILCFCSWPGQEITRAHKGWALDNMVLCNEVTKWMKDDIAAPPAEGVYVYGLYLEGAGWDKRNMKLIESKPKVLFELMPVIRIYAENNSEFSLGLVGITGSNDIINTGSCYLSYHIIII